MKKKKTPVVSQRISQQTNLRRKRNIANVTLIVLTILSLISVFAVGYYIGEKKGYERGLEDTKVTMIDNTQVQKKFIPVFIPVDPNDLPQ
jgi:flagellar basal body-associated protein FliL